MTRPEVRSRAAGPALVQKLRKKRRQPAPPQADRIPQLPRSGTGPHAFPLSFAQERIWFQDQLEPGNAVYKLYYGLRLAGPLDVRMLGRAVGHVVARQESLRTRFALVGAEPRQIVAPPGSFPIPVVDLSGLAEADREREAREVVRRDLGRPFDLSRGPLLRMPLVRLGSERHLALLSMHHIVSDYWSMALFVRELAAVYTTYLQGRPPALPVPPVQYADFASWQRDRLTPEVRSRQLAYWREALAGELPALDLPVDRPRPPGVVFAGARRSFAVPPAVAAALRAFVRTEGTTVFMAVLSIFSALLARDCRVAQVVLGSVVANRSRSETHGLIGLFLETVAYRVDLEGEPTLRSLLHRVRALVLGAAANLDVPFEEIVRAVRPERGASRPLYQVMLVHQNLPAQRLQVPGAGVELSTFEPRGRFETVDDLDVYLNEVGERLVGSVEYNADLFDATTVDRLARRFVLLLEQAVNRPGSPLAGFDLLAPVERHQVLEWNATAVERPAAEPVHHLVERQAARAPDAVAVVDRHRHLSYGELSARSRRLAARLRELGVASDHRVAVCLEPCLERPVAVLAVLAAGGAYAALDPSHPDERLEAALELSGATVLLADEALRDRLRAPRLRRIVVDRPETPEVEPLDPERLPTPASSLVYVTFTSGSTGEPKGVAMTHGASANLVAWHRETLRPGARTLQFASLGFDVSFQETFTTLTTGGTLVVVPGPVRRNMERLARLVLEERVARLFLPVAVCQHLAADVVARGARVPAVEDVITAGEQLQVTEPVARLFRELGSARLHNHYGPSETHVVTVETLPAGAAGWPARPPIGRPIANARTHVVDRTGSRVPLGVLGELLLGGVAVGRGYLDRAAWTAERFVPDRFERAPGRRLYRSGDLARWLPDGRLEFSGRTDHQIKVHGVRVEPAEIEERLAAHPAVAEAAVVPRTGPGGGYRLVAYLVPQAGERPAPAALREFLAARLPEGMLPALYVWLPALPLTPNGKLDRQALPEPRAGRPDLGVPYEAPETPFERRLAAVWEEVLEIDRVGRRDNFLALGGDSVLALRMAIRARQSGIGLDLEQVYGEPDLATLARRVETAGGDRTEAATATPEALPPDAREVAAAWPATPMQRGILFHCLYAPGTGSYVEHTDLLVEDWDRAAFLAAWERLVAAHPVLRSAFSWAGGGEPRQWVARRLETLPLVEEDWSHLDPEEQEAHLAERLAGDLGAGWRLERPPLFRVGAFRLGAGRCRVLFSYHHLLLDGWSKRLLLDRLRTVYDDLRRGRETPLNPGPPFRRFAEWLTAARPAGDLAFWERYLRGWGGDPLGLGHGAASTEIADYGHAVSGLDRAATEGLGALARASRTTRSTVVLAGWALLLARLSGRDDVVFGNVFTTRPIEVAGVEEMLGLLINTLPVRLAVRPEVPFGHWLKEVGEGLRAVEAQRYVSLAEVQRAAGATGDRNLLDHFLVFESGAESGGGWPATDRPARVTGYPFYLLVRGDEELRLEAYYDRTRLPRTRVVRWLRWLTRLLAGAVDTPGRALATLDLMEPAQRHQVLREWNDTAAAVPAERGLAPLFAERAARHPEALAVVDGGRHLSYGALERHAGELGDRLRARGVGRGSVVALLAPRGLELLVGILAAFREGAAYLPLDPRHPRARQVQILERARPDLLLEAAGLAGDLGEALAAAGLDVPVVELAALARPGSRVEPPPVGAGTDLAYVLYTSGSTGVPKGAMVEQRGMVNHLFAKIRDLGLGSGDVVAQNASQTFDISVWQLLAALLAGGSVRIVREEVASDPAALLDDLDRGGVTVLELVPSLLRFVLDELDRRGDRAPALSALRWLVPTGEALPPELVRRWLARYPRVPLLNAYGPTECSDDVTHHVIRTPERDAARVPVGAPVANLEIYVLEHSLSPALPGADGEVFAGGAGVGRGYLAEPGRTAEAFVPDPVGGRPGERLYRTGDVGRLRDDGSLDFLGRMDHQVKVRGHRIETEEIDAAAARHPEVVQALVVACGEAPAETRLAGYFVARRPGAVSPGELRGHLADLLPEYMVPPVLVELEAFPLTANGKIDRRALPEPDAGTHGTETGVPLGVDPVEELVAGVWAVLLGRQEVKRDDHFFELGGHSLLATQVVARLREALGVEVPLRLLFDAPRLEDLARRLTALLAADTGAGAAPPLRPAPREGRLPLSFAQQRLWLLDRMNPGSAVYNVPMGLRFSGPFVPEALAQALGEVARRHEVLRTVFRLEDGEPVQVVERACPLRTPNVDLAGLAKGDREEELVRLSRAEAQRPFDLRRGPMMRLALPHLDREDDAALFTFHHAVSDGWSMRVLVPELVRLYRSFAAGEPSPLPELPIQYADFAVWQRSWLQGETLETELTFWRRQLAGAPATLDLPTDRRRPPIASFRGASRTGTLPPQVSERVLRLARERSATLFMVLLAAFQALLSRYSGNDDLVVGTSVAGRTHVELENLIGFFVNTLALRGDLSGSPGLGELVSRARAVALAAYAHQEVPFEKLVEHLAPERSPSHTPLFQVGLVVQNARDDRPLELPELSVRRILPDTGTAKVDLSLAVIESAGELHTLFEYSTDLFDATTVQRLESHLVGILSAGAEDPDRPFHELPMLGRGESFQVLREWAGTDSGAEPWTLPGRFRARAAALADAVAVVDGGEHLSFSRLDRDSDRLAAELVAHGVGPEARVGVALSRSPRLVATLLAVAKAGAAYVPLDPVNPRERLRMMLEDSGASLLVTEEPLPVEPPPGLPVVRLDADRDRLLQRAPVALEERLPSPDALAYVMYTSGSTGRPKGIGIPTRAVLRLLLDTDWLHLDPTDRIAQVTNVSFDPSTAEIWGALLSGCRLEILSQETLLDPESLARELEARAITTIFIVTAVFQEVARRRPAAFAHMRQVGVGGEAPDPRWMRRVLESGTPGRLFNGYGPTETTMIVSWRALRHLDADAETVPIGRPRTSARVLLADRELQPVPIGVPGELLLGGSGLARGYHGRPALTAAVFVPDPFVDLPGRRLYRSGDLGRLDGAGDTSFLGRLDQQVKVRGLRLELGEVAAALMEHPAVDRAVATVRDDGALGRVLVGYWISAGTGVSAGELSAALQERLPGYMVPRLLVELEAFPLTVNGKIDLRALPDPREAGRAAATPAAPPETDLEEEIAAVWREVLGLDEVGIDDNFFDLGGHSLLIIQVHERLSAAQNSAVEIVDLFNYPTIRTLAGYLGRRTGAAAGPSADGAQTGRERARLRRDLRSRRGRGGGS